MVCLICFLYCFGYILIIKLEEMIFGKNALMDGVFDLQTKYNIDNTIGLIAELENILEKNKIDNVEKCVGYWNLNHDISERLYVEQVTNFNSHSISAIKEAIRQLQVLENKKRAILFGLPTEMVDLRTLSEKANRINKAIEGKQFYAPSIDSGFERELRRGQERDTVLLDNDIFDYEKVPLLQEIDKKFENADYKIFRENQYKA